MNILLLSAGGPTAHGVIKSLRDINFDGKIVSVDSNPLSAGLYLSDSYHIVPKAFDDGYMGGGGHPGAVSFRVGSLGEDRFLIKFKQVADFIEDNME